MGTMTNRRRVIVIGVVAAAVGAGMAWGQRTVPNLPDVPVREPAQNPPQTPVREPARPSPTNAEPSRPGAASAGEALVTIVGSKQGRFRGEGVRDGARDRIVALLYDHELTSDKDSAGRPEGRVRSRSLTITKAIGAASPQIFQAATTGETLETVTIELYRAAAGGGSEGFYTVTLRDARIVSLKQYAEKGWFYETIGLSYGRIEVEHRASKARAEDPAR